MHQKQGQRRSNSKFISSNQSEGISIITKFDRWRIKLIQISKQKGMQLMIENTSKEPNKGHFRKTLFKTLEYFENLPISAKMNPCSITELC